MSGSREAPRTKRKHVARDGMFHMKWIQGRRSVLWTDPLTSVVCLVISKQGAVIFSYETLADAEELNDNPKMAHQSHARQIFEYITYFWNEDDDLDAEIVQFEDKRIFLFLPDAPLLGDEHNKALSWLKDNLPQAMNTRDANPEKKFRASVLSYRHPASRATALIEVDHDGTNILPKVLLNGIQVPPTVPEYDET